ncbi:SUMF1/EgtB/PvdO family nonheme iron enzyme [Myxococcota bacterium]
MRRYLVPYRVVAVIGLPVLPAVAGSCQSGASTGSDEQLWDPGTAEEATEAGGAAGAAGAAGAVGTAGEAGATGATGTAGEAGASCFGTRCGSYCVDLSTDVDHCGVCGRTCSAAGASKVACEGGGCKPTCKNGVLDCETPSVRAADDGCETDAQTSAEHCGACGRSCSSPRACQWGTCVGPSCLGMGGVECYGESCCQSLAVSGGEFRRGRETETCSNCVAGCPPDTQCDEGEQPEHLATVSRYGLDKYEVTVGRFRAFLNDYDAGWRPSAGEGAHPEIDGSGWQQAWDVLLPSAGYQTEPGDGSLEDRIACCPLYETWQPDVGSLSDEIAPINCVNWHEAFAFCVWDGGRLPTESEWEYAAAGGDENRLYPWGSESPAPNRANFGESARSPFVAVGSYQSSGASNGRWGHSDLSGSVWEWTLDAYRRDAYADISAGCSNCVDLTDAKSRVVRGGAFNSPPEALRCAARYSATSAAAHGYGIGLRCARTLAAQSEQ